MNISAVFVRRPVASTLLAVGALLLGALCLVRLPIASLPAIERPTLTVSAKLPGASADTIASTLAQPLETQLGIIPGIVEMASFNASGGTQIVLQFALEKNIDTAASEVQAALNAAAPDLPKTLPSPPTWRKANPAGFAPIAIALTSDVLTPAEVYKYADTILAQKLAEVPGVARAYVSGAENSGVRIRANPQLLANMSLSLERVRIAVRDATQNLPTGSIHTADRTYTIRTNDQLVKADEYRDVTIAYRNGAAVRLQDVAKVSDNAINDKLAAWLGRERAVLVFALKQPDANVVQIVDRVKALLPEVKQWLPPAIKLHVLYDRTTLIRASIVHVEITIAAAVFLVTVVIALFLKRAWATLIPGFTIPVVLAIACIFMSLVGYSLDNLSLMAIIIAIGFIVDDAIIIVENIMRLMDEGHEAASASVQGAGRMAPTVLSITGALIGALLPILFMPDIIGRYFREFGMTLAAAIIVSAVISLTLTPMLCSRLLGRQGQRPAPPQPRASRILAAYLRSLDWILVRPLVGVALLVAALAGSAALYAWLPKGFMPTQDTGVLSVKTLTTANISFPAMEQLQRAAVDVVLRDPAVEAVSSFIGTDNGQTLSTGTMFVVLKPREIRKESMDETIARLRKSLAGVSGIRSFFTPWQDFVLTVQNTPARFQYTLTATDGEKLWNWSTMMQQRIAALPEIANVISSAERAGLETGLVVDRERAAAFGVTSIAVNNTLYDAFGQRWASILYLPTQSSEVVLEVDPDTLQSDPSAVRSLFVPATGDKLQVPLGAFTRLTRAHASMWIRHNGQFPSVTLSFDLAPGVSIGDAIAAIRAVEAEVHLPDDVRADFRGEADEAAKARAKQLFLLAGAVFAVYVVLGMLYESYALAFVVLTALPSAAFGALLALAITHTEFSVIAAIACILVVGLAMKNAIIMVDFAAFAARHHQLSSRQAIRQAARLRVRPIMMTSIVAILMALPLALSTGPGHELRQPLGIATVGGLLVSLLLTLYTTPAVYLMIDRLRPRATGPLAHPA